MTFTCAITHQKHLTQSGCSTQSAVDIFNTLRVFTESQSENKKLSWSVWISFSFGWEYQDREQELYTVNYILQKVERPMCLSEEQKAELLKVRKKKGDWCSDNT